MTRVQPKVGPLGRVVVSAALRHLVVVVRKEKVFATRVEVNIGAERNTGERGAFDVPARSTVAPTARPRRLVRLLLSFPQREVVCVTLFIDIVGIGVTIIFGGSQR